MNATSTAPNPKENSTSRGFPAWLREPFEQVVHLGFIAVILLVSAGEFLLAFVNERWLHLPQIPFLIAVSAGVFVFVICFALLFHGTKYVVGSLEIDSGSRLSKFLSLAAVASAAVLSVSFLSATGLLSFSKRPVVVIGSSNVRSYLLDSTVPNIDTKEESPWLDIGSGPALRVIFQAVDYGHRTGTDTERFGLVALSSEGADPLARMYLDPTGDQRTPQENQSQPPNKGARREDNYLLDIELPPVPLVLLFKGNLKTYPAASLPEDPAGRTTPSYRVVPFSNVKDFFRCNFSDNKETWCQDQEKATLYVPEADSGTRALINKAGLMDNAGEIGWPPLTDAFRHYEEYVEDFPQGAFGEFVTWVPLSRDGKGPAKCNALKGHARAAAVLAQKDGKQTLVWTRFSVVMKVSHHATQDPEFEITNKAECDLAKALDGADIEDRRGSCLVKNAKPYEYHYKDSDKKDRVTMIDRIAMLQLSSKLDNPLPSYLTCPGQE